ncbi:MAG: FAD-binding protein [Rhodospirillales bacterium]|nr:MAG: FAD-binding protein [Rhodospirillales bacterium]
MSITNVHSLNVRKAPLPECLAKALEVLLGNRATTSAAVREQHGRGEGGFSPVPPDIVCFPNSNEEVAAIVRLCAEHTTPVIPFGTGTSLEGHVLAPRGGVCIDLSRMDNILEINSDDLDCRVQAGVTRKQLNDHIRDSGLFFPVDPGADASLGGMAATRASGTNAVRYGTMREAVLGLTVVMADGRLVRTGGRARKSASGYDLTRLLVGSEGTLGVITEVQLRLFGIPEAISAAVCQFETLEGAVNTVIQTIQLGVPVARIELLDEVQLEACIIYSRLQGYERKPTLFFEFHGSENGVAEQAETVGELSRDNGGGEFRWAVRQEDRNALWQARHDAYFAACALRPGRRGISSDVCVPISRLPECIMESRSDIDESGLVAPIVGHVGDGNFHVLFVIDPDDPEETRRAQQVNERMVHRALAMGGTCTGEHGIGIGKMDFLVAEHGEAVGLMRTIKLALDPHNIMNPDKILRV